MAWSSTSTFLQHHPGRPLLAGGSFKVSPLKQQSLFLSGGCSSLREILLLADFSQPAAQGSGFSTSLPALHIVNSQKKQLNSGLKSETNVLQSSSKPNWDGTKALAAAEGFCIVVAAASYTTSVIHGKQPSLVASSSAGESKFLSRIGDLSTWYIPALWAAIVIDAILRMVQRKSSTKSTQRVWEERSMKDFTLDQRVGKLEEDVQGVTTIARMQSRHLEKLGVRFRATRRNLRDPMQETVGLAQKTSAVVRALATREEILEKELQEMQQVLVAMQAQQSKQLELLVAGMTKTLKSQQASEERILKELAWRTGGATGSLAESGSSLLSTSRKKGTLTKNRKQYLLKDIGKLWKGLVENEETSSRSTENEEPNGSGDKNGHAVPGPDTVNPSKNKPVYNPDISLKKEDFWAITTPVSPTKT